MMYDYKCPHCQTVHKDVIVAMSERETHVETCSTCELHGMKRTFPVEAAMGYQPFEAYFDPALDMDINGRGELKEAMSFYGVQQAGDKKRGARNEEVSENAAVIDISAPTGRRLSTVQREKERDAEDARRAWQVQSEDQDGNLTAPQEVDGLPSPSTAVRTGKLEGEES